MDLEQLMAELAKAKPEDVIAALQTKVHAIFQTIYDQGHSAATGKLKPKLDAEEAARKKAEDDLKKLEESNGDVKKIHEQYKQQIQDLTATHKQEIETMGGTITTMRQGRVYDDFKSALVAANVDPEYADIIVQKPDIRKRFKFDGDKFEILQKDKEIALVPATGQSPIKLLVDEVVKEVNPKFLLSGADRGGATRTGAPGEPAPNPDDVRNQKIASKHVDYGAPL